MFKTIMFFCVKCKLYLDFFELCVCRFFSVSDLYEPLDDGTESKVALLLNSVLLHDRRVVLRLFL